MSRTDRPDLTTAADTDEIYDLAFKLAAWGLRNGECDGHDALEWVLSHPHEAKLPRTSSSKKKRMDSVKHHIESGVERAVDQFIPGMVSGGWDYHPDELHDLAAKISGSGVTHEKYLLGAIALGHRHKTDSPVITARTLADVTGVHPNAANKVIRQWRRTHGYGFFSKSYFDGEAGNGTVFWINLAWLPVSRPKHKEGCQRKGCDCLAQNSVHISQVPENICLPNCALSVAEISAKFQVTRPQAKRLWRAARGLPEDATEAFRVLVGGSPAQELFTVRSVSDAINVTGATAQKLLLAHVDDFFGGAYYNGTVTGQPEMRFWRE